MHISGKQHLMKPVPLQQLIQKGKFFFLMKKNRQVNLLINMKGNFLPNAKAGTKYRIVDS